MHTPLLQQWNQELLDTRVEGEGAPQRFSKLFKHLTAKQADCAHRQAKLNCQIVMSGRFVKLKKTVWS